MIIQERMEQLRLCVADLQIGVAHSTIYDFLREKNPTKTNSEVLERLFTALDLHVVGSESVAAESGTVGAQREVERLKIQLERLSHEVKDAEQRNAHLRKVIDAYRAGRIS